MGRLRNGVIRYTMWRLAELAAALVFAAFLLAVLLGAPSPIAAFGSLLILDFGAAAPLIAARLTVTLPLALMAVALALAIGLPAGAAAARERRGIAARVGMAGLRAALALPAVWLAMVLVVVVAGVLRLLPPGGFLPWQQSVAGALLSLILPAAALALPLAGTVARTLQRTLVELPRSPEVLGARASGVTERQALLRLGTRAAVAPLLDLLGRQLGLVIAGATIVETVFYLPGLGRLLFEAVAAQDAVVVRSALFVLISIGATMRFVAAIGAALSDARLRTTVLA
jgi:peptide/nickel transport system permease protein